MTAEILGFGEAPRNNNKQVKFRSGWRKKNSKARHTEKIRSERSLIAHWISCDCGYFADAAFEPPIPTLQCCARRFSEGHADAGLDRTWGRGGPFRR